MHVPHQKKYWDKVAFERDFTTPLDKSFIVKHISKQLKILDFGCGYGRSLDELYRLGYRNLYGLDISSEMINRANKNSPHLQIQEIKDNTIPYKNKSFDVILLFAVLTCIVDDTGIKKTLDEILRVLKPGGYIMINDFLLNEDTRNVIRYKKYQQKYGVYGVFELPDGGVLRHFSEDYLNDLIKNFSLVKTRKTKFSTMNGNTVNGIQHIISTINND